MRSRLKITLAAIIAAPLLLSSCNSLKDSYEDCGVWLEFVFDHNMEFADSFGAGMGTVDVLVFDADGKFYSMQSADVADLPDQKRMFLGDPDMPKGKYTVVAVGGLTEHFSLTDVAGAEFVPGVTTLEQVKLALIHNGRVAHEFPHLWFAPAVEFDYRADLSVFEVRTIRQTNKFHITVSHTSTAVTTEGGENKKSGKTRAPGDPLHTVEIIAPESGAYDYLNTPFDTTPMSYTPFFHESDSRDIENGTLKWTNIQLNTMRLLEGHGEGYRLVVKDAASGATAITRDLLTLLSGLPRGKRPDGSELPLQEFLDRQGEWTIVIEFVNHSDTIIEGGDTPPDPPIPPDPEDPIIIVVPPPDPDPNRYVGVRIIVNDWVVWDTTVDV